MKRLLFATTLIIASLRATRAEAPSQAVAPVQAIYSCDSCTGIMVKATAVTVSVNLWDTSAGNWAPNWIPEAVIADGNYPGYVGTFGLPAVKMRFMVVNTAPGTSLGPAFIVLPVDGR